jgi:hypothetical protein
MSFPWSFSPWARVQVIDPEEVFKFPIENIGFLLLPENTGGGVCDASGPDTG